MLQQRKSWDETQVAREKYRHLFENLADAAFVVDFATGLIVEVNGHGAALMGKSRQEIIGMHHAELFASAESMESMQEYFRCFEQSQVMHYNVDVLRKDGTVVPLAISASLLVMDGHRYVFEICRDTTEIKRAEKARYESQERFHQLSDASFEGVIIHEQRKVLDANRAFAELLGYNLSEIIGADAMTFIAPESHDIVLKNMTGYEGTYEFAYLRKDGTRFLGEVSVKTIHYQGRMARVAAVRDITARRQAENILRESEEKLRIMFESIMEGVIVCNSDRRIVQLNNAAIRLHGYQSQEELLGRSLLELVAEKGRAKMGKHIERALERGCVRNREYVSLRKGGIEFDSEVSIAQLGNPGKAAGFIAVARDITERKQLRETMHFYISQITRAQEEERKRIARELHDDTVQSLASLALEIESVSRHKDGLATDTIQQLGELADKARNIMKEVRRVSHKLRPDVLDQLGLLAALQLLTDELNAGSNVNARIELIGFERRLKPEAELVLFRIAQETLHNIAKHSQATDAVVRVEFSDTVKLSITDNGKGFELPKKLCNFAGKGKLGLVGMHERARLLGGDFKVESNPGKGTTVSIEIKGSELISDFR